MDMFPTMNKNIRLTQHQGLLRIWALWLSTAGNTEGGVCSLPHRGRVGEGRAQDCAQPSGSQTLQGPQILFLFQLSTFLSPFGKLQTTPGEVLRASVFFLETTMKREVGGGFRRFQGEGFFHTPSTNLFLPRQSSSTAPLAALAFIVPN